MTGTDVRRLTPADGVAAVRSFPRRYRESLQVAEDEDLEELARRSGPDGRSAHALLEDTVATFVTLERALRDVLLHDHPTLPPATVDPTRRQWDPPEGITTADAVELLADSCSALASVAAGADTADWSRRGRVADGPDVEAVDLLREAVRVGADNLRAVERAMRHARHGPA